MILEVGHETRIPWKWKLNDGITYFFLIRVLWSLPALSSSCGTAPAGGSGFSLGAAIWNDEDLQKIAGGSGKLGKSPKRMAGCWSGTIFILPKIGNGITSQLTSIFFKGVGIPPTRWDEKKIHFAMGLSWWQDGMRRRFISLWEDSASIGRRNGMCDGKSRGYDGNNN